MHFEDFIKKVKGYFIYFIAVSLPLVYNKEVFFFAAMLKEKRYCFNFHLIFKEIRINNELVNILHKK